MNTTESSSEPSTPSIGETSSENNSTVPTDSTTPTESSTTTPVDSTVPSDNSTIPTDNSTTPVDSTIPVDNSTIPVDSTVPTDNSTVPIDCSIDGFFCVDDGEHDFQYLECSQFYKGFRPCAAGTKCLGESHNPYTHNPCAAYSPVNTTESSSVPTQSSSEPSTPSVGETSSENHSAVPIDCTVTA